MERVRQVAAVITGILVIIVLILLARWTGDRIRERFLTPRPPAVSDRPATPTTVTSPASNPPAEPLMSQATISAIPSTGPVDFGYFLIGFLFLSGLTVSTLAKRFF